MFRFSIRELMLVMLTVGLGIGWWLDRHEVNHWKQRTKALEHVVLDDGWTIQWQPDAAIITKPTNDPLSGRNHGYDLNCEMCDCGPSVSF